MVLCYAHENELLMKELEKHLSMLRNEDHAKDWHDPNIDAGTEWRQEIEQHLNTADIILLLMRPDFMHSNYCYSVEMKQAMERHERGEARVIPILLRPVDFTEALFSKLQVLPATATPITLWRSQDEAFYQVAMGIRDIMMEPTGKMAICRNWRVRQRSSPSKLIPPLPLPRYLLPKMGLLIRRRANPKGVLASHRLAEIRWEQCNKREKPPIVPSQNQSNMSNLRFGEQSQAQRVIRRDCTTSEISVAGSTQCYPLDGTRARVGPCGDKQKRSQDRGEQRDETTATRQAQLPRIGTNERCETTGESKYAP